MKITILTHKEERKALSQLVSSLSSTVPKPFDCVFYEKYDDFIKGFSKDTGQAVIVARRGADGMECARTAKLMQPNVPLIWFSNDHSFGVESYRIGCAFFSAEAITETVLLTALKRCSQGA